MEVASYGLRKWRRFVWRLGRRLYSSARGEHANDLSTNGEAYVQACVINGAPVTDRLQVLDIGANEGEWTQSLLKQVPAERCKLEGIKVDMFEPVPTTVARLRNSFQGSRYGQCIEIHPTAISSGIGEASIAVLSKTGGTNTLHFDDKRGVPPGGWVTVPTTTVTAFCSSRNIQRVHLAKCDTEGHDLSVLHGARGMFADGRIDTFQFEYNHRWILSRTYLKDVFDLVDGIPYKVARLGPTLIEILPHWHPELERFFESNYLLVREDVIGWFKAQTGTFDESNTFA